MQSESGKEPRSSRHGDSCAIRLLAASGPADVVATIAARLPVPLEAAFWSPAWPEAISTLPADARDVDIARAVREVAAWKDEGRCDPRYVVVCADADGGTAVMADGGVQLVVKAGPFGEGSGGHSHSDALSLTARLGPREILIDPGTFTYIADPAERSLPPLALKAMTADGGINVHAVIGELIRSPWQFASLRALAADSGAAFRALKRCGLLPGLFLGLGAADL